MSNIAIGTDGKEHFADDFQDGYTGDYFYPNPDCHVRLKLKNIGSDEKARGRRRPYFSAGKAAPHIEGCGFSNTCPSFESLQKAGFRADDFFQALQMQHTDLTKQPQKPEPSEENTEKHNSITTLNKLYHYCLQHRDEDILPDGTKIFEIYQEDRNKNISNGKRRKFKMVKLRFWNCNFDIYDEEKYCYKVWCIFPHTEKEHPPGTFYTLGFREENLPLMRYFCKILTPLKKNYEDVFLLVGGEWQGNHCCIASKRQIFILPLDSN